MTTDRKLLELAAKAAGGELKWFINETPIAKSKDGFGFNWNPLTEDGDALRLAVKLGLQITVIKGEKTFSERESAFSVQDHGDDPYAATRRAIVRAAAEIGKSL